MPDREVYNARIGGRDDKKFLPHPLYGANVDRRDINMDPPDIDDDVVDPRHFKPTKQFDNNRKPNVAGNNNYYYNNAGKGEFEQTLTNLSDKLSQGFDDMDAFDSRMNKARN